MLSKRALLNWLPLVFVILLAAFVRFLWLDKVPNAIGGDELAYAITAKSIAISGSDLTGTWNPLSVFLFRYPPGQVQAELPYFLQLPAVGIMAFSLLASRLTDAMLGVLTVILTYAIASKLFNKKTGLIAAFITSINPWLVYISRTTYEMIPATFFYLLSFYFLMFMKGRKILIAILLLLLAFYSDIASKVFFLPFVFLTIFYAYFFINNKKFKKEYLSVLIFSVLLVLFFLFSLKVNPQTSRLGEIVTPNNPVIANQVNQLRKDSIQTPLNYLLVNKYTVYFKVLAEKLFNIFSADYLFVSGDRFFSIFTNGLFYYLDALFLLLGLVFVFLRKRRLFYFFSLMILFAAIPHVIHGVTTENFTPQISMVFPFMIIFISVGIWETVNFFKNKTYFYVSGVIIGILYLLLLLNFLNIYFFQWTLQGNFDFPIRVVSKYAALSQKNGGKILVYSTRSYDVFTKYLFYTNSLNKNTYPVIKKDINNKNYEIGNIKFLGCDNTIDSKNSSDVIIYDGYCAPLVKYPPKLIVPRLTDGGESYAIYNDNVCKGTLFKSYPSGITLDDFSIENMDAQTFCNTYITSP